MLACLAVLAAAQANAQEKQPPQAGAVAGGLEEVIVTARRREESIQSVPVAVSAVGGAELTAEGVTDVVALGTKMPGLTRTDDREFLCFHPYTGHNA